MMLVQTSSIRFADRTVVLQHASCADLIHAVHNAFAPEIAATGADAAAFVLVQRIAERGELQVDSEETLREARLATEEPPLRLRLERAQGSAQRVRRVCGQCGAVFSSRNRLFRHIEDFGHEGDDPSGGASSSGRSYVLPAHAGFNAYYSAVSPVAPSAAAWAEVFAAFQRPVASIVRFRADSALAPLASRLLEAWTSPAECGVLRDAAIGIGDAVLAPGYPRGLVGAAQECGALSRQELNSMLPPLLLGRTRTHQLPADQPTTLPPPPVTAALPLPLSLSLSAAIDSQHRCCCRHSSILHHVAAPYQHALTGVEDIPQFWRLFAQCQEMVLSASHHVHLPTNPMLFGEGLC
jgi:hypothetical protein